MPPRKELCRNFQRGSCQYGDRCKFLHATDQQTKSNPFQIGMQNGSPFQHTDQQQMPNPFGFGVQNNNQPGGGNYFGTKPNQFKPFENKWIRPSPSANSSPPLRKSESQSANHECTDPETCKHIIAGDLENERPLWKLTCYGHKRNGPCDIVGDISSEELRALAYEDAKQGKSLQFIIDRERSLVNSKLVEFQNLVKKPHAVSSNAIGTQSPFTGTHSNPPVNNTSVSPPVSSFSQLGASLSTGAPNYTFGQSSATQNNTQPSNMFQMNSSPFNRSGTFGSQVPHSFSSASFSNSGMSAQRNPFSTSGNSLPTGNLNNNQMHFPSAIPGLASTAVGQSSVSTQLVDKKPTENPKLDDSIWSKLEWGWNTGEIPEEEPPDAYIF